MKTIELSKEYFKEFAKLNFNTCENCLGCGIIRTAYQEEIPCNWCKD